jgi:lipopolysaccharide export system permease protein
MKIIDKYIIKKFLGTFFFSLSLIIIIVIVFDISEKIDDFLGKKAPMKAIIFDYYLNFIPYFVNLFSPLFTFIAVIFFTAQMANRTEIIAILGSGISFKRLLFPYFLAATALCTFSLLLNNWIIPPANKIRLEFENRYIRNAYFLDAHNFHRQIKPGEFMYFESYNNTDNIGYRFSYEKINNGTLSFKILSDRIQWDSTKQKWSVYNYMIRNIEGLNETVRTGARLDTTFYFKPADFNMRLTAIESMNYTQLNTFIEEERLHGSENIKFYEVEKYKRIAFPFATFILTLIGVSLASRKVRGGIGAQLGLGIAISFVFIMFMQVSTTFATNGNVPAYIAVWIPNLIFGILSLFLLRIVPK